MTTIAHLSDLHLLEDGHRRRRGFEAARLSYLSMGRSLDAPERRSRVRCALAAALAARVDHVVITGDLTEDGTAAQFEVLAALLAESGLAPEAVTLVPGNHDAYGAHDGWARALEGPLRPWAPTSTPGAPVVLGDVALVPVSTAVHQSFLRSGGAVGARQLAAIDAAVEDGRRLGRAVVVAQHHPPIRLGRLGLHWIDGLVDHARALAVLAREEHAHVVHGHVHRRHDRVVCGRSAPQVFSTGAVVEDAPPRVYEVRGGRLVPAEPEGDTGGAPRRAA